MYQKKDNYSSYLFPSLSTQLNYCGGLQDAFTFFDNPFIKNYAYIVFLVYGKLWPKEYGRNDLCMCPDCDVEETSNPPFPLFWTSSSYNLAAMLWVNTQAAPWRSPKGKEQVCSSQLTKAYLVSRMSIERRSPTPVRHDQMEQHGAGDRCPKLWPRQICGAN